MNSYMSEEDIMIHVLNNLPSQYESIVEKMMSDISIMRIEDVREELQSKYRRLMKYADEKNEDNEHALIAGHPFKRKFKGKCNKCGIYGHKAIECRGTKTNQGDQQDSRKTGRFNGKCNYCGKIGHKEIVCRKKQREQGSGTANTARESIEEEMVLMCHEIENEVAEQSCMSALNQEKGISKFDKNTWIGDTGATSHMVTNADGLIEAEVIDEKIKIGNGQYMRATKKGKLPCVIQQTDGTETKCTIEVKVLPDLWCNLFSITAALRKGFSISNEGMKIVLKKGSTNLKFDRIGETVHGGYLIGINIIPRTTATNLAMFDKHKKIDVNYLHRQLGHAGEALIRSTAKVFNWSLKNTFHKCEDCATAKARQKNIGHSASNKSKTIGERLCIDISSVKERSFGGSKFWNLVVDEASDMKWSLFLKQKSDLGQRMISLLLEIHNKDKITIKNIRCDNAGENRSLQQLCAENPALSHINFEFTARDTPQQNGTVERAFATLYGRIRATNNCAKLPLALRNGLWTECAATCTTLDTILCHGSDNRSAYQKYYNKDPPFKHMLRVFGEVGIVKTAARIRNKLDPRGEPCIFIGYTKNHSSDTYRMLNLRTNHVILTRDIQWLNKLHHEYKNAPVPAPAPVQDNPPDDPDDDEDAISPGTTTPLPSIEPVPAPTPPPTLPPRAINELRRLETFFNPDVTDLLRQSEPDNPPENVQPADVQAGRERLNLMLEHLQGTAMTMMDVQDAYETVEIEPTKFEDAWNHPEPATRDKWRTAIKKELNSMTEKKVWKVIKIKNIPEGRKCIKHKWVFKIKRNGTFRARLVACGYSQVPGIDFQEIYAPVINDVSYRIILIIMIVMKLDAKIVDIETAFLHGDLDVEQYMERPKGLNAKDDEALLLLQSIYGLTQSARQFWKKICDTLMKIGFTKNQIDPCVLMKKTETSILIVGLYVDDMLCVGTNKDIEDMIKALNEHGFKVKVEDELKDYLSCEIKFNANKTKAWMCQPHLMKKMEQSFGGIIKEFQRYKTPGTPGYTAIRPKDETEMVKKEMRTLYRSGVGMLLFLVKHTRPDLSNPTRELSKNMDGATPAAMKELLRVIKFAIDTKDYGLKIEPNCEIEKELVWNIELFTDSDYAGDRETRVSVSGFILYVMGVAVMWRSRGQRSVTLSSSEAEYVALSEAVKEIKFVYQLLTCLGIKVKLPIIVRVDNVGAIFMSENVTSKGRTKHVDIRYHFVREFVEENFIKIIFVKTKENDADIFTKNVDSNTYETHMCKFMENKSWIESD